MKIHVILSLAFTMLMATALPSALADPLPGTPLGGEDFSNVSIVAGVNVLPGRVTPGDVVLRENPNGGDLPTNWSNIVRFFDFQTVFSGVVSLAYQISDGEAGIPRVDILDHNGAAIQPNSLNPNNQFINEIQAGTGTDADITQYHAAGALYNIHSDAASPELAETFPPTPGQLIAIVGGGKAQTFYHLAEMEDRGFLRVPAALVPGLVAQTPADGGDSITIAPDPGDPRFSFVFLTSIADDDVTNPSGSEQEPINVLGDESTVAFLIDSADVPEPSTWLLLGSGLAGIAVLGRKRLTKKA